MPMVLFKSFDERGVLPEVLFDARIDVIYNSSLRKTLIGQKLLRDFLSPAPRRPKNSMFLSVVLIALITVGGLSLTYFFSDDEPLLWRIGAGGVVGCVVFGLVSFLLACFFGFTTLTLAVSFLIVLSPLILFRQDKHRAEFRRDWQRAKGKLEGASFKKFFRFGYYAFFFAVFCLFFVRAIIVTPDGIFTGASQNYGDLPFHLGAIFSFTDGNNFPPENPSYAFAKFSYPFMADLVTAAFVKLGASVRDATFVQNVWLAFSLLVILERFIFKLTGSRLAGKIAPVILFFSGGLGFVWFLKDWQQSTQGFFDFMMNLPRDYTISGFDDKGGTIDVFRWGNSLVALFITQRSLLLGMPLTIIALQKLWEIFVSAEDRVRSAELKENFELEPEKPPTGKKQERPREEQTKSEPIPHSALSLPQLVVVGMLAGTLPLVHVHSLAVLFVVTGFLLFIRVDRLREWLAFGIGVSIVAIPELIWVMTGSATRLTEFIAWHFGWHKLNDNFFWFWFKNTGALIPILLFGIYLIWVKGGRDEEIDLSETKNDAVKKEEIKKEKIKNETDAPPIVPRPLFLLFFYLPFLLLFFISNVVKLAPWEWDNVKILAYWFVGSLPIISMVLAWAWNQDKILKIGAVLFLFVLTLAGALDVWRTVSRELEFNVFSRDSVAIAEQIKQKTAPNAMFLNAPTFNSAVALTGRRSLMRYTGHLFTYGINYHERESEVRRIYAGDATAEILLEKYNVEYVLISPEERAALTVNEQFFQRFPVVMEVGQHRVYQVKK